MGIHNVQVIIDLAETIIAQSQSNQWVISIENYQQLGSYNGIIALHASEQQKKDYCYLLYRAQQAGETSPHAELFGNILLHFRQLCRPLLNNLDSFIPTISQVIEREISSARRNAMGG